MTVANWICLIGILVVLYALSFSLEGWIKRKLGGKSHSARRGLTPNAGNISATGNSGITPDRFSLQNTTTTEIWFSFPADQQMELNRKMNDKVNRITDAAFMEQAKREIDEMIK